MEPHLTIRLEGFDALESRLRAMPGKVRRKAIRDPLRNVTTRGVRLVRSATPRRTGLARRRVVSSVRVSDRGGAYGVIFYKGRTAAVMGMYERGTVRQPARPFFDAVAAEVKAMAPPAFRDGLKAAVEKAEASLA